MNPLLLLLLIQEPTLCALASTTNDTRLPQDPVVLDSAWLIHRQGQSPSTRVYLPDPSLSLLVGDLDGNGNLDEVEGIDALVWSPSAISPGSDASDFLFSTERGFGTFNDGDLLRWLPTQGLTVEWAESDITLFLQPNSGTFDLDAATVIGEELFFSMRDKLIGTVLGDLEDGDILAYHRGTSSVRIVYSEGQVQALVDHATGQTSAITDVLSLSQLPGSQELCFTVQSPTQSDSTVYAEGGGGRIVPEFQETNWGFQVSSELDALAFVPGGMVQPPILSTDLPSVSQGSILRFKVRHGTPGAVVIGFRASKLNCTFRAGAGLGFILLDKTDYWLLRQFYHGVFCPIQLDGSGSGTYDWTVPFLPNPLPYTDMFFQGMEVGNGFITNPIAIRVS